jgi:hypothetical protein
MLSAKAMIVNPECGEEASALLSAGVVGKATSKLGFVEPFPVSTKTTGRTFDFVELTRQDAICGLANELTCGPSESAVFLLYGSWY